MARLQDIATAAGVSVSTVSKALRGFKEISAETRRKVTRTAIDLGYEIKRTSHDPVSRQNLGVIGVICVEVRSNFYASVVGSLEAALHEKGYNMLLGLSNFDHDYERLLIDGFIEQGVDGLICVTNSDTIDGALREAHDRFDVPAVLLATIVSHHDFDSVKVNDDFGVREAVRHLVGLGHQSIGFVGDALCQRRLDVFLRVLSEHGVVAKEPWIRMGAERFEYGGYLRMKELLAGGDPPTAIVASYDDVAIGAMRAIDEANLSVPEDISIVGFDGIVVSAFLPTPLTTLIAHTDEMAKAAVNILVKKVEHPDTTVVQHLQFNPELVIRDSTAPPPQ